MAVRGALLLRTAIASGVLAILIGGAFVLLLVVIDDLRQSARLATQTRNVLVVADTLEKLVIDLETGQRGFVITREERFLDPWKDARAALPAQVRALTSARERPTQAARERAIARAIRSYVRDYSVPLVRAARRGDPAARSIATTDEGRRRINALRSAFDRFTATERALLAARQRRDDANARRAVIAATGGLVGSIALIALFGAYLTRKIALPVRRAAGMAGRMAGGDLSVRLPETESGEIGELERSFNRMGRSLQTSRAELTASRARVLAAADDARRRVVRDLHDGAQQRLVHTIVTLKLARRAQRASQGTAGELVDEALVQAERANAELRELAHGILPAVLTRGGLRAGVDALVARLDLPVSTDIAPERFPPGIEANVYFIVAEALTNVVKHAGARRADVRVWVADRTLHVAVRDDGVGGATSSGPGLIGLEDRLAALGGRLSVESPPGDGTLIAGTLPLP